MILAKKLKEQVARINAVIDATDPNSKNYKNSKFFIGKVEELDIFVE